MEKHPDPLDSFIKEAMKGHRFTPKEQARKAFLEEASAILPPRKGWKYWYFIPVAILFISSLIVYLVVDMDEERMISQQSAVSGQQSAVSGQQSAVSGQQIPTTNDQQPGTNDQQLVTNDQEPGTNDQEPGINDQEPITNDQEPVTNDQEPVTNDQEPVTNDQEPVTNDQEPIPGAEIAWRFAAGLYYLPEVMFNTVEGNKYVHNTGIDAIFYYGLISIRTGLGVSVSKGITENSIQYNDYLGAYNKLDSITFTYNEEINNFEPSVYTSSEKVWDSIEQSDSTEIVKRYAYFQVPLVLGFDFWQKGKISIGVRVGTIMSVLMNEKQLTGAYDSGENLVVGMSQLTPSQVNLNWQAVGGFAASAALTEKLYLDIEPQVRYYYGSIYEKSGNVKKPWSVGLRLAAVYKF